VIPETRMARAADYRTRMRHDVDRVLMEYGVSPVSMFSAEQYHELLEELVECGMHPVEHLLHELTT
jgi:hypothetical protein